MTQRVYIGSVPIEGPAILAPMAGITDHPFRMIAREMGAAAVLTEMVSADGLVRNNEKSAPLLRFEEVERPVGVQLFGSDPEIMAQGARLTAERRPDWIDLNFGCPVRKVVKRNAGSRLMRDPERLGRIVEAVVKAVALPVTAKIRSGWGSEEINAVEVAQIAQEKGAKAITIHPRTQQMGFSGTADWRIIAELKSAVDIPIIGNGDIWKPEDARRMLEETGCDRVMVARGARGNPWIFKRTNALLETGETPPAPDLSERIALCLRHLHLMVIEHGELSGVRRMRKHIVWYTKELQGGSALRQAIFGLESAAEVEATLQAYRVAHTGKG